MTIVAPSADFVKFSGILEKFENETKMFSMITTLRSLLDERSILSEQGSIFWKTS